MSVEGSKLKESDIRKQIQDYLRWTGWTVFYHLQGLGSFRGMSDLQALKDGRSVFIEVKTPRGRQSEHQKKFQEMVEAAGLEYVLARGVEDVEHLGGRR
jgi:tRNA U54 and U55 pseudouridine synthase Pus10